MWREGNGMPEHPTGLPLRGDESCDTCAWLRAGRCVAAGRDEAGVPVPAGSPACRLWEAPPACLACGACCREAFDTVPLTPGEVASLQDTGMVRIADDGWTDLARVPSPLGRGTRCAALGADLRCAIYPRRPDTCRGLELGSAACVEARRRVGLSPWPPGWMPEGPWYA